ncbi:MAG: recombinase family protein [Actinomycetota bacterium]
MLTVAYCRVSTEEQASEGWSIDGQAEKLRSYAELHDLGPVTVIADPGWSGKSMDRPGLQQLLTMLEQGHLANVLIWRLDRLSRNLGDLILLAERFGKAGVGLHSFTEKLDLSSATGRMFYNILGSFAQFYREQLAENVRLGTQQAVRQGRWVNRPKTGYDLANGRLVPNARAATVRRIFQLRAEGLSHQAIERQTGVKWSTVGSILKSRIYVGEVLLDGEWFPGEHESIITREEFAAAHRGFVPGVRRRSSHVLASRVRCGLCGRAASVHYAADGQPLYRCRHRGGGCAQPARSARGLERAAVLGLRLVSRDAELQGAIRRQLALAQRPAGSAHGSGGRRRARDLEAAQERRRKLLELYYADAITADLFRQEEQRLLRETEALRHEDERAKAAAGRLSELAEKFEEVARILREMDIDEIWREATESERRVLIEDLLEGVDVFPDHLEVRVAGVPRLNVLLEEVGLHQKVQFCGVGEGT